MVEIIKNMVSVDYYDASSYVTRKKVFKVVMLGTQGKGLYSALAGRFGSDDCQEAARLKYAPGVVTRDVEDGEGIFFYMDKDYAISEATKMAAKVDGRKLAIYTAKPIGDITIPDGKSMTATSPALLLLEKLMDIKPVPVEKWESVSVNNVKIFVGASWLEFYYEGKEVANLRTGKLEAVNTDTQRVTLTATGNSIAKIEFKK